jgi:hypothetical protein
MGKTIPACSDATALFIMPLLQKREQKNQLYSGNYLMRFSLVIIVALYRRTCYTSDGVKTGS